MKKKVIVGMSGGVDSSVAAWLLLQENYDVQGLFMKNWEQDDHNLYCTAAQDFADAQAVCKKLKIPLLAANFSKDYWDRVFSHFLDEYTAGRTPNPDILCNKEIKFKSFLNYALQQGADYIATGHYARVLHTPAIQLLKAKDREKDQTYFLHAVESTAFQKTLFPLGDYLKKDVRAIAQKLGFPNHNKKDSTGLCFIGERPFGNFLKEYLLGKPGEIKSTSGETLGQHQGLMFYTLGQRQGLGIGGTIHGQGDPWFVVEKELVTNTLIVAQGKQHPRLYAQGLICGPIHWIGEKIELFPLSCYAKTRYRQQEQACLISPTAGKTHTVVFASLQRAVTPGQYVVFYEKNKCLGGAIIEKILQ